MIHSYKRSVESWKRKIIFPRPRPIIPSCLKNSHRRIHIHIPVTGLNGRRIVHISKTEIE
nr:MAG TPA: hypothetical protein [Caudoviricetes sp.]